MVRNKFWKKKIQFPIIRMYRHVTARRVILGALFFIITALILGVNFNAERVALKEGQPSPKDFFAQQSIVYESQALTDQARTEAEVAVPPEYRVDKSVLETVDKQINDVFNKLISLKNSAATDAPGEPQAVSRESYRAVLGVDFQQDTYAALNEASPDSLVNLAAEIKDNVRRYMRDGIQKEAIPAVKENIIQATTALPVADNLIPLAQVVVSALDFQANLVFDAQATLAKKEEARRQVAPVVVTIRKNQKIVGKGDIVTAANIETLQHLGMLRVKSPYARFAGILLFVMVMYALIGLYIYFYRREVYEKDRQFNLLGLIIVTTLVIAKTVSAISIGGQAEIAVLVGYLVPVAAGSMLISILLDNKLAIFVTVILSIFVGMINGGQLQFAVGALVGGVVGVFSVSRLSQRSDLAKASIYIMLANILTIISLGLISKMSWVGLLTGSGLAVSNGVLSSVLTIGLLPFLESAFHITTPIKLLELSNPNQPLLKRMLVEAPGTYHHSIMVGNMAEAAADAVGVDSLLARVGAYYHDIGKLKRPYFFTENQLTQNNPHDRLAPTLSTLIINSHVKDGVEMAEQHALPDVIRDIVRQHHGSSMIGFFYRKAIESCEKEEDQANISPEDFRYETPKPQTKEAAIVMLADGVEAGVRSKQKLNPGKMEGFVRQVIKDRFDDGQLEECDLTFKELDIIAQAFVKILSGIFHTRIEYPDSVLKEIEKGKDKNGNPYPKPADRD
ncbi:HDIG domain-containing protein [Metallumcola ferriviriculae]|uniref:HDIG domain-containing protein n=1 Tax=Metallumcola ferriviriculae TaxID=3039180 RepID=A0AAU0UK57_9FIRM|nr:HDIG domain-containing protein [Desulfitibacteraceae bacterium MK1]